MASSLKNAEKAAGRIHRERHQVPVTIHQTQWKRVASLPNSLKRQFATELISQGEIHASSYITRPVL